MTRVSLDYESTPVYYLTVRADEYNKNGLHLTSTCLVRIDLVDVNDNKPLFDQYVYVIKLNENTSKMTSIFQLNATDAGKPNTPNSQVNYKLLKMNSTDSILTSEPALFRIKSRSTTNKRNTTKYYPYNSI
jgi:protocadherin gamma subfamily A